jgi:hypothetical protein
LSHHQETEGWKINHDLAWTEWLSVSNLLLPVYPEIWKSFLSIQRFGKT